MNTRIEYLYRDTDNFKQVASIVLSGAITPPEIDMIAAGLESGEYFIPSQVGLPDLQSRLPSFPDPQSDHVWHELEVPSGITLTTDPVTHDAGIDVFARTFTGHWDVEAAMKRLGLPR